MSDSFDYLMAHLNEINKCEEGDRDHVLEHHLNNALKQMAESAALKEENESLKSALSRACNFQLIAENESVALMKDIDRLKNSESLALADLHSTRQRAGQLEHELLALKARVAELEAHSVQAVANNICKHIPPGYEIRLHMENGAGYVELSCEETGNHESDFGGDTILDDLNHALGLAIHFNNDQ